MLPNGMDILELTLFGMLAYGYFRVGEFVASKEWFLTLCVLIRFSAGVGSAMLTVAATSMLMKSTSYSSATIVVSNLHVGVWLNCCSICVYVYMVLQF